VSGRRCAYCGHRLEWRDPYDRWASVDGTCRHHRDLPALDSLRDPVLRCRMMDHPDADLPRMSDELREAVQATKGTEA
jgi:hypothetical protein